jgi:hypothetical protein
MIIAMRALNRSAIGKKYRGKWVALKNDRKTVVASGKSVQSVAEAAKKKGIDQPIITRIPRSQKNFVGML